MRARTGLQEILAERLWANLLSDRGCIMKNTEAEFFQKKKKKPKTIPEAKILRQRGVVVQRMFGIKSAVSPL